ncbi:MAG: STAS domain-containing protein [Vicingaceae bacterium]
MSFEYRIEEKEGVYIVYFNGRILDRSEAENLMDEMEELMSSGKHDFVINLSGIDYMNSAGLGVLISLLNQSRDEYGTLVLCSVPEKINQLIITSKLQNIFKLAETQEEALKTFEK